ncbi:MAG: DUF1501 domain-containing protein [Pirellulales bacterium]|jgi:hypothetical protein
MTTDQKNIINCGSRAHLSRRNILKAAGLGCASWLTPLSTQLALSAEQQKKKKRPQSVIMLWLQGAPSQFETFDPHPGTMYGGDTTAIKTSMKGVEFSSNMPQSAEVMQDLTLLRCTLSKEGDHERAAYNMKTGYRPDPTLIHPSIGAIVCHELSATGIEIPRHVSILPGPWPGRGGFLGNGHDAFKMYDPKDKLPDLIRQVPEARFAQRRKDLDVLENSFLARRRPDLEKNKTIHLGTVDNAIKMMSSEQIKAFDISKTPKALLDDFGDTPFGRGCLCATQLIETGVRCVEITLTGWDSHVNNHEIQKGKTEILDPAFAALIKLLKEKDLYDDTIVICCGEFGRSPGINPLGGRDHWPHGFSVALGGGGIRRGLVLGETDPEGSKIKPEHKDAYNVEDIHATIHHALGVDHTLEYNTPIGRPMAISHGKVIDKILDV